VLIGDQGRDEFWLTTTTKKHIADDSSVASMRSRVHHVASFWNKIKQNNPARPRRVNLPDPSLTSKYISYRNFSTRPLFSGEGPTADDVAQGYLGDCYFLATLSSVAGINPSLIRRSIVDLGDGTYGVQFLRGNQKVVVRVDADLPTLSNGQMAYAGFGAENSIWVGIMEKAWAFFRYDDASYASTEGGWMGEVYDAMGQANRSTWYIPANKTLLGMIRNELNAGRSVTFGVGEFSGNIPLISYHAYSVDRVVEDAEGNLSMVLRNPWAIDGAGNDGNDDGYVTINEAQAQAAFLAYSSATVA
jgi:hypothetical protein